jgi:hypothetical protein
MVDFQCGFDVVQHAGATLKERLCLVGLVRLDLCAQPRQELRPVATQEVDQALAHEASQIPCLACIARAYEYA